MNALHAPILQVDSPPRRAIYSKLINALSDAWTVSQLASSLPSVSVEAIRTTIHLLMGEQFVELVPHMRSMTVRVTDDGADALREILASWGEPPNAAGAEKSS